MNLHETAQEQAFRADVRAWMQAHLCGEFAPLRGAAGLGTPGYDAQLAKRWEQEMARGGWTGLGWPSERSISRCF